MKEVINSIYFGDMVAKFIQDTESKAVGLSIVPTELEDKYTVEGKWRVEPLTQIKVMGDAYPGGFSHGHSMRNSNTAKELCFKNQELIENETEIVCVTKLEKEALKVSHYLKYNKGDNFITSYSEVENCGHEKIGVEMISSFNLCGFPMVTNETKFNELFLHRLRSKWSGEGKLETNSFLDLQLEPSWSRNGAQSERFGQVGSMPVRKFFPWMIIEDKGNKYSIGVQLNIPSSWQLEVYNRDDKVSISGGIADREFGHWYKYLARGEKLVTPKATITTAYNKNIDEVSARLVSAQLPAMENKPQIEKELPIVFNEFCTSWGAPSEDVILKSIEKLKGKGIKYYIIDAGWYTNKLGDWQNIGDWEVNKELFPNGIGFVVDKIKEAGMIPGIWFEFELVGETSKAFENENLLLKRDGYPIQTDGRRFLDMRKPEVTKYLEDKVINFIKKYDFGYLKVDYNDNIGIGCEGADSLGEGLRQNMLASQRFLKKISEEVPKLVIENCSSGGHRLEPSMMSLCSMASFSDAHECKEIPIIGANVLRAILPTQSQLWAVLRKEDDEKRLIYTLSSGFLGRLCLSGDIFELKENQWNIVKQAIKFYSENTNILGTHKYRRYGNYINYYNKPEGWQGVLRIDEKEEYALMLVHTFNNGVNLQKITIDIECNVEIVDSFARKEVEAEVKGKEIIINNFANFEGIILKLKLNK